MILIMEILKICLEEQLLIKYDQIKPYIVKSLILMVTHVSLHKMITRLFITSLNILMLLTQEQELFLMQTLRINN